MNRSLKNYFQSPLKVATLFALLLAAALFLFPGTLQAQGGGGGFWELSLNGSYFTQSNGEIGGDPSKTVSRQIGAGVAYRFMTNTSVEFSYRNSRTQESFTQLYSDVDQRLRINRENNFENYSLSLVLDFAPRGASFRPYVKGGGGYTIRKSSLSGILVDDLTGESGNVDFQDQPSQGSISALGGLGLRLFVIERVALDASYTMYATELDKAKILFHHAFAGGLRYVF